MSIASVRAAFLWMLFALFLSMGIILNDFSHLYHSPYWDNKWTNMIVDILIPYAWKIGFVLLLVGMALGLFLVVSHIYYYVRLVIRKIKKEPEPLSDRQILMELVSAVHKLTEAIEGDRNERKNREQS